MRILITGGTGFLGTALTKYFADKNKLVTFCKNDIVVFGRNEAKLSTVIKDPTVKTVCGDVRDYDSIYFACKEFKIDLIIHAAALKRIDTCQDNPIEAFKTNVEGTLNCIKVCKELPGISLCFVSTDKACEPCTTYGATKYLAEQLVRRESKRSNFNGYVIRYGNVLNSTGSVFGIWERQFESDGKVMVRDKTMTRFFWKVEDSVKYIAETIKTAGLAGLDAGHRKGEVFIPKLKALNIYEMACHIYGGDNVYVDKCSHTEKIHESLSGDYCSKDHVVHPKELL